MSSVESFDAGYLKGLAKALLEGEVKGSEKTSQQPSPDSADLPSVIEDVKRLLFPTHMTQIAESNEGQLESILNRLGSKLLELISRALCVHSAKEELESQRVRAKEIVSHLLQTLPELQRKLFSDVQAAYEGDPALFSIDEAIACYPGIRALVYYRLAHELELSEVPLIPRMLTELAHSLTGIDIHPAAIIGDKFFIDHGTGVVIGATAIIGNNVRLYQGVILGAKSIPKDENGRAIKGVARHPIIEDDVVIYAGAAILGRVTIGRQSVIGGNVWITCDVSPGTLVTQAEVNQTGFSQGAGI